MKNDGAIISTGLGSKFSPDDHYFLVYFGLKNIVSPNSSILRHDNKGLFIYKIPKSVFLSELHIFIPITPHWEARLFLSFPSFLFLFSSQSVCNVLFVQLMEILIKQEHNFSNDFQLKLWIPNYSWSTNSISWFILKQMIKIIHNSTCLKWIWWHIQFLTSTCLFFQCLIH